MSVSFSYFISGILRTLFPACQEVKGKDFTVELFRQGKLDQMIGLREGVTTNRVTETKGRGCLRPRGIPSKSNKPNY